MLQYLVAPVTILAASLCTASISCFKVSVQLSQTTSEYSKRGRIKEKYTFVRG